MFRGLRSLVFSSDAPPIFAAISIVFFLAWLVVFWLWMNFASHLPPPPCKPTDTLIHFRSETLCATAVQAAHWTRQDVTWKALFVGAFVVQLVGVGYRRFVTRRRSIQKS
jgi:hypothetical protein